MSPNIDAKRFTLTSVCYTAHGTHLTSTQSTTDISRSAPPKGHDGVEELGATFLKPGGNSLLHVGVCCLSVTSQVLLEEFKELDITGHILQAGLATNYGDTLGGFGLISAYHCRVSAKV
jgi:hypothetical protein